jgi:hypothetical protein
VTPDGNHPVTGKRRVILEFDVWDTNFDQQIASTRRNGWSACGVAIPNRLFSWLLIEAHIFGITPSQSPPPANLNELVRDSVGITRIGEPECPPRAGPSSEILGNLPCPSPIADTAAGLFYKRLFETDPCIRTLFDVKPLLVTRSLPGSIRPRE